MVHGKGAVGRQRVLGTSKHLDLGIFFRVLWPLCGLEGGNRAGTPDRRLLLSRDAVVAQTRTEPQRSQRLHRFGTQCEDICYERQKTQINNNWNRRALMN